jgi:hypothetical protein
VGNAARALAAPKRDGWIKTRRSDSHRVLTKADQRRRSGSSRSASTTATTTTDCSPKRQTHLPPPTSHIPLPAEFRLTRGAFGGIETQLASNGTTTFAAASNLALPMSATGYPRSAAAHITAVLKATGEMVAVNQNTGKTE